MSSDSWNLKKLRNVSVFSDEEEEVVVKEESSEVSNNNYISKNFITGFNSSQYSCCMVVHPAHE